MGVAGVAWLGRGLVALRVAPGSPFPERRGGAGCMPAEGGWTSCRFQAPGPAAPMAIVTVPGGLWACGREVGIVIDKGLGRGSFPHANASTGGPYATILSVI